MKLSQHYFSAHFEGKSMKNPWMAVTFGLMLTGAFLLPGCTDNSPVAPVAEQAINTSSSTADSTVVSTLTRIVWPVPNQPETDSLSDSVYVTPDSGGMVKVKWTNYDSTHHRMSSVSFTLQIPAHAVTSPKTITITVDKNAPDISAEFGPSGTVFLTPALLDVQVAGLDLSSFSDTDNIDLWYVNPNGWINTMQYNKFRLNTKMGTLAVTDLQIPHFSRYCFGR
ncbi:MAG: hypothetical protein WB699_14555 [Bacteroidota bacterium]